MYRAFFKRVIDFSVALVALLLILPILLVVAIVLYFANKEAGVFFIQERPGKNGKYVLRDAGSRVISLLPA